MIRDLAFKPNFARTVERFEAWWQGEVLDRPPITLSVRAARPARYVAPPATPRERWLNVEYAVDAAVAELERRDFVADSLPVYWPNLGPEIAATVFGCELTFGDDTSWSAPVVTDAAGWDRVISTPPDFDNVYWRTIERMTDHALSVAGGRFLVGVTDLHGNYDLLAALRDPEALCVDLIDCPQRVQAAGRAAVQAYLECFRRLQSRIAAAGMGTTTWCRFYHEGPAYIPSCDFWCLVSGQIARDLILPNVLAETQPLERSVFHLDGPQALRHLDLLLAAPALHAVQWVYGTGQGRASDWLDVYRRIRAAGKSAHVVCEDPADALTVLGAVGPAGLWIQVHHPFDSVASAEAFVRDVERASRRAS